MVFQLTCTVNLPRTMSIGYVADMAIIPAQAPAQRRKTGVSSAFSAQEKQ
jgi:hypothetical protein